MQQALLATGPFVDWSWIQTNAGLIRADLVQHLELSAIAVGCGLVISFPLALVSWRFRITRSVVFGFSALLYTIPSIALFVLIQPLTGYFSLLSAEVALVSYTLLILIRNMVTGLEAVPEDVREAAAAAGYTTGQQLRRVYLPLSLPAIFAGLRVAAVTVIGLVTVTAFIGWGGLGQLIVSGFESNFFATPIVTGLVLAVALAALSDAFFVVLQRLVIHWKPVSL